MDGTDDRAPGGWDNAMVLVRTTVPVEEQAAALARRLVVDRVAACVHYSRIESVYTWEGLKKETEWLVEARAPAACLDALWEAMLRGHPYETPMVEVLESLVPDRYAEWARSVTT